jgi:hypothetical protein
MDVVLRAERGGNGQQIVSYGGIRAAAPARRWPAGRVFPAFSGKIPRNFAITLKKQYGKPLLNRLASNSNKPQDLAQDPTTVRACA